MVDWNKPLRFEGDLADATYSVRFLGFVSQRDLDTKELVEKAAVAFMNREKGHEMVSIRFLNGKFYKDDEDYTYNIVNGPVVKTAYENIYIPAQTYGGITISGGKHNKMDSAKAAAKVPPDGSLTVCLKYTYEDDILVNVELEGGIGYEL